MLVEPEVAVETLLDVRANWNFVLIGVALVAGGVFEGTLSAVKARLPKQLLPAIESSVSELATLGFVGLFIQFVDSGGGKEVLEALSTRYVGEEEFLVERFEILHEALFSVSLLYFAACTVLIVRLSAQFGVWAEARRADYLRFKVCPGSFSLTAAGADVACLLTPLRRWPSTSSRRQRRRRGSCSPSVAGRRRP